MHDTTTKTLYIQGTREFRILRDGPALRVRAPAKADCLFPLKRVERVVVKGEPNWDTAALLACASAGISITFVGGHGDPNCVVTPVAKPPRCDAIDLDDAIQALMHRPGGALHYRQWVANQNRFARIESDAPVRWAIRANDPTRVYKAYVAQGAHYASRQFVRRCDRQLLGLLQVLAREILVEFGVDPNAPCLTTTRTDLPGDLASVAVWQLYAMRTAELKRRARKPAAHDAWTLAVALFEANRDRLRERLEILMRLLHEFLIEMRHYHGD